MGHRNDGLRVKPLLNVALAVKAGTADLEIFRAASLVPPGDQCGRLDPNDGRRFLVDFPENIRHFNALRPGLKVLSAGLPPQFLKRDVN